MYLFITFSFKQTWKGHWQVLQLSPVNVNNVSWPNLTKEKLALLARADFIILELLLAAACNVMVIPKQHYTGVKALWLNI